MKNQLYDRQPLTTGDGNFTPSMLDIFKQAMQMYLMHYDDEDKIISMHERINDLLEMPCRQLIEQGDKDLIEKAIGLMPPMIFHRTELITFLEMNKKKEKTLQAKHTSNA